MIQDQLHTNSRSIRFEEKLSKFLYYECSEFDIDWKLTVFNDDTIIDDMTIQVELSKDEQYVYITFSYSKFNELVMEFSDKKIIVDMYNPSVKYFWILASRIFEDRNEYL